MNKIIELFPKQSYIQVVDHYIPMELTPFDQLNSPMNLFFPFAKGVVSIKGKDRISFLQAITTGDVLNKSVGSSLRTLFTNTKGKILFDCFALFEETQVILVCDPGEEKRLIQHLSFFHITEELTIENLSEEYEVIYVLSEQPKDQVIQIKGFQNLYQFNNNRLQVYLIPASTHALQSVIDSGFQAIGLELFEQIRLIFGFARAGVDFGNEQLPQEASLEECLSFSKGCFVGQEPIARIKHRGQIKKRLVLFLSDEGLVSGHRLFNDAVEVGRITSTSAIKTSQGFYNFGYLRTSLIQENLPLTLRAEDQSVTIRVIENPK